MNSRFDNEIRNIRASQLGEKVESQGGAAQGGNSTGPLNMAAIDRAIAQQIDTANKFVIGRVFADTMPKGELWGVNAACTNNAAQSASGLAMSANQIMANQCFVKFIPTIANHIDERIAALRQQIETLERTKEKLAKADPLDLPVQTLRYALY